MDKKELLKLYIDGYKMISSFIPLSTRDEIKKNIENLLKSEENLSYSDFSKKILQETYDFKLLHEILILYNLSSIRKSLSFIVRLIIVLIILYIIFALFNTII